MSKLYLKVLNDTFERNEYFGTLVYALCTGELKDDTIFADTPQRKSIAIHSRGVCYDSKYVWAYPVPGGGELYTLTSYIEELGQSLWRTVKDWFDNLPRQIVPTLADTFRVVQKVIILHGKDVYSRDKLWMKVLHAGEWCCYYIPEFETLVVKKSDKQYFVFIEDEHESVLFTSGVTVPNMREVCKQVLEPHGFTVQSKHYTDLTALLRDLCLSGRYTTADDACAVAGRVISHALDDDEYEKLVKTIEGNFSI